MGQLELLFATKFQRKKNPVGLHKFFLFKHDRLSYRPAENSLLLLLFLVQGGFTVLTSVRLIWATNPRSASFGVPCVLPLFSVVDTELKIEGKLTSLLKPSKIKLTIRLDEQGYPTGG